MAAAAAAAGVLKVHGHPLSPAMMRVLSALQEKGLDFEVVLVDMAAGEHKKEPFLSLNPFGKVPAFEDGDLKMFESRAITQYLAHTYADVKGTSELLPHGDTKKMAEASVWMEVEAQTFEPLASKLTFQFFIKPMMGLGPPDESTVAELQGGLAKVLDVYEARLARSEYLGGSAFGLADLHHQPKVHQLMGTQARAVFEARPHVRRWVAAILARPAWAKVAGMAKSA